MANAPDGITAPRNGSTDTPNNTGKGATPGSGVKGGGGAKNVAVSSPSTAQVAAMVGGAPGAARQTRAPAPRAPAPRVPGGPGQTPAFLSAKAPMGTPQPAPPRPGLAPPYPDARSPQATLMPNGQPIMPPPVGFIGPGMIPRVPATFAPGMTGLLGR